MYFSEQDYQRIAEILGVSELGEEARQKLHLIAREYLTNIKIRDNILNIAKTKAELTEFANKGREFSEILKSLSPYSRDQLKKVRLLYHCSDLEDIDIYIDKLCEKAEEMVKTFPADLGGRPREKGALRDLIKKLDKFTDYQLKCTRNPRTNHYEGSFLDLIVTFLEIVNPEEIHSTGAIAEKIIEVRKNRVT